MIWKNIYMHPYIHCRIIHNSHGLEAAQGPTVDEWIKKTLWYIYTMEHSSAIKKKETLPFAIAQMDL